MNFPGIVIISSVEGDFLECHKITSGTWQRMNIIPFDSEKAKEKDNMVISLNTTNCLSGIKV